MLLRQITKQLTKLGLLIYRSHVNCCDWWSAMCPCDHYPVWCSVTWFICMVILANNTPIDKVSHDQCTQGYPLLMTYHMTSVHDGILWLVKYHMTSVHDVTPCKVLHYQCTLYDSHYQCIWWYPLWSIMWPMYVMIHLIWWYMNIMHDIRGVARNGMDQETAVTEPLMAGHYLCAEMYGEANPSPA